MTLIKSNLYDIYLLFPIEKEEDEIRRAQFKASSRKKAFILIDGTWKEARRIFNKSEYLTNIPIVSIDNCKGSKYKFRRGATLGQLCTYEAALEVLNINNEVKFESIARKNFEMFLLHFEATIHGHKVNKN